MCISTRGSNCAIVPLFIRHPTQKERIQDAHRISGLGYSQLSHREIDVILLPRNCISQLPKNIRFSRLGKQEICKSLTLTIKSKRASGVPGHENSIWNIRKLPRRSIARFRVRHDKKL